MAILLLGLTATQLVGGGESQRLRGYFTLLSSDDVSGDLSDCSGTGGYDDVDAGVSVTIRDQGDNIVGSATLENAPIGDIAELIAEKENNPVSEVEATLHDVDGEWCILIWEAKVEKADFYDVQVGKRGKISYSRAELAEADWIVATSLGD